MIYPVKYSILADKKFLIKNKEFAAISGKVKV